MKYTKHGRKEIRRMGVSKPPIFIVDDDEAVLKALQRLITSLGYYVQTFTSAQEFLDSVPADTEGFLILDVFMPRNFWILCLPIQRDF
jgi:FixJ family two-component response regulator